MIAGRLAAASLLVAVAAAGCGGGTLDVGRNVPHGLLPVDERNPVIIDNDLATDNWSGVYAMLLAASGGPPLAGIIVSASDYWGDLGDNVTGWSELVKAARDSGLPNIPTVTASAGAPLVRPADGNVEMTTANHSAGGELIVSLSRQLGLPSRPVVVLVGTQLTNVADAYLIDHSVADRVVVVASLGMYMGPDGVMSGPNGELDPWADWIVAQRFRYVQASAYYDQSGDVSTDQLSSLPANPLGAWMAANQPDLFKLPTAADQVTVLAVGVPGFAAAVQRAAPDTSTYDPSQGPRLLPEAGGNVWVITQSAAPLAGARLWQMLLDPHTFGQ